MSFAPHSGHDVINVPRLSADAHIQLSFRETLVGSLGRNPERVSDRLPARLLRTGQSYRLHQHLCPIDRPLLDRIKPCQSVGIRLRRPTDSFNILWGHGHRIRLIFQSRLLDNSRLSQATLSPKRRSQRCPPRKGLFVVRTANTVDVMSLTVNRPDQEQSLSPLSAARIAK